MNILRGYETMNIFRFSRFPFLISAFLINPFLFLFLTDLFFFFAFCIGPVSSSRLILSTVFFSCDRDISSETDYRKQTTEQITQNTNIPDFI
jgi:hypothetical protein